MIIHQAIRRTRPMGMAALGALAGDPLARALGRLLDDDYHYLRGVPAAGDTIDTIVVGPGGTWAIAPINEHGRFRKRNGHWYRWNRGTGPGSRGSRHPSTRRAWRAIACGSSSNAPPCRPRWRPACCPTRPP